MLSIRGILMKIPFSRYCSEFALVKGTPLLNLKSKLFIPRLITHENSKNVTIHFEFQTDISILATVSEELATPQ